MKQSYFTDVRDLFPGSEIVRKFSFKTVDTRGYYALLAVENCLLAHGFSVARGETAHFSYDCFECLPPHEAIV